VVVRRKKYAHRKDDHEIILVFHRPLPVKKNELYSRVFSDKEQYSSFVLYGTAKGMKRHHIYAVITVPVFGILFAYTAIVVIITSLLALCGMKRTVVFISWFWARSIFMVLGKQVHIQGKENQEKRVNYILLANHSSLFDIMAIMSFNPGVSWFGREYLLKIPVFGFLLRNAGYIPMKTANFRNTKGMVEQLVQNSEGKTIAIFPEGTRTLNGKINHFHRGFIYVLKASKSDILPVTLNGLYSLKPKNRFYIDFGSKIHVVIHKPVKSEDLIMKSDLEIINIVKNIIESANYN
jgi:1-acyl-sn-glycerol-3-phosphate acyltransferase